MSINDNLQNILDNIKAVGEEDRGAANILMEGFSISLNMLKTAAVEKDEFRQDVIDIQPHLDAINNVLGIDIEQVVLDIISKQSENSINSSKEADKETLDFITADEDIDDYETFLKENNITETLEELKKEV